MEINIVDSGRKKVTKAKIDTYEYAIHCFLQQWGILKEVAIDLYLDLKEEHFTDQNSIFYNHREILSYGGATLDLGNNKFVIFINRKAIVDYAKNDDSLMMDLIMGNLAHEITHVKQYYFKELEQRNNCFYWKGTSLKGMSYEEYPHEIEANEYAVKMRDFYYLEKLAIVS